MDLTFQNLKNPHIREEIKQRIKTQLKIKDLPLHRKYECESIMYQIKVHEDFDKANN